jgi:DNA-binding transcriptional MerR regulator
MATPAVAFLSADVLAETGATASYLAFLVRAGIVAPSKYRNGHTNLFSEDDIERVRWAVEHRGQFSIDEMRQRFALEVAR